MKSWPLHMAPWPAALGALMCSNVVLSSPPPHPEWQRKTVEVRCGPNVLGLSLETRRLTSSLGPATINGQVTEIPQRAAIEARLQGLASADLSATVCHSDTSLGIGISGSRLDTPAGEEDDIIALFELTFAAPAIGSAQPAMVTNSPNPSVRVVEQPRPRGDLAALITIDDYPVSAIREGLRGVTRVRLTVDPSGRVSGCAVTQSSGHSLLDSTTCMLLRRRARFTPARDNMGQPTGAVIDSPPIRWAPPPQPGS